MLSECHISTMLHHYHQSGDCPTISRPCLPMVRAPHKTYHRPRPLLHVAFWESTDNTPRHPAELVHGLSSPNRWVVRMEEPMGGTISSPGHIQSTHRLVHMAPN